MESRTQGSTPRPRTQKKIRGQGQGQTFRGQTLSRLRQECSRLRPRTKDTSASALQKKKKKSSQKFFRRSPQENVFQKIFQALHKILTIQKIVWSSSRGQTNFRGLRPRGQGQGLDLRGQRQGLQNVSSRPRTSSKTPPLLDTTPL